MNVLTRGQNIFWQMKRQLTLRGGDWVIISMHAFVIFTKINKILLFLRI